MRGDNVAVRGDVFFAALVVMRCVTCWGVVDDFDRDVEFPSRTAAIVCVAEIIAHTRKIRILLIFLDQV